MDDFNPDPNHIPDFILPENLLDQIYEFSGTGDSAKGFLLAFVGFDCEDSPCNDRPSERKWR